MCEGGASVVIYATTEGDAWLLHQVLFLTLTPNTQQSPPLLVRTTPPPLQKVNQTVLECFALIHKSSPPLQQLKPAG